MSRISTEFKEEELPLFVDEDGIVRDSVYEREIKLPQNVVYGDTRLVLLYTVRTYTNDGNVYGGRDNLGFPPESEQDLFLYDCFIKNEFEEVILGESKQLELFNLYKDELYDV